MRSPRAWKVCLGVAGSLTCALGLYHTMLPFHMGWRHYVEGVPDSITWALFALNFSWSVLVVLASALVLYAARLGPAAGTFARRTVFTVGLFWLIHGAYTWVSPLPLPSSLAWLKLVLWGFPAVVIALHWIPLVAYRRTDT